MLTLNTNLNKGFTLLELLVVLFIMVIGFTVVGINISTGENSTAIKAATRDMASALRYTRGQALLSHQEATLSIDLSENNYRVSNRAETYNIQKSIDLTVVTAQNELSADGTANIRFFPDGSSTGGKITLEHGKTAWEITINWLTGQINSDDAHAKQ